MKDHSLNQSKKINTMNFQANSYSLNGNQVMTTEQFNEIVGAILDGKYSWACVLILSFAGYNPLHYIPYRTYNRLLKENGLCKKNTDKKVSCNHFQENDILMKDG